MIDKPLSKQIEDLEDKYNEIENEYDLKLEEIADEIADLQRHACQDCEGTGEKYYKGSYPDFWTDTCNKCCGTGSKL